MTTDSELATALAFVLQKWKDTGADPVETKPFDDLLERLKADPAPSTAALVEDGTRTLSVVGDRLTKSLETERKRTAADEDDLPPPKRGRDYSRQLAILDEEIDAVNEEAANEWPKT